MNLKHLLCAVVAGAGLLVGLARSASAQPAYLAEMPSVETVRNKVKGASPIDTLAQQTAVFDALQQIAEVRTERPGSLADLSRLSPGERALIESYRQAAREIFATPGVDRGDLLNAGMRYSATPGFQDQVAALFFSPAWLADYAASRSRFQHAYNARPTPESPAPLPKADDRTKESAGARKGFFDKTVKGPDGEETTVGVMAVGSVKMLGAILIGVLLVVRTIQRVKNRRQN
jgi:hypothetical protein